MILKKTSPNISKCPVITSEELWSHQTEGWIAFENNVFDASQYDHGHAGSCLLRNATGKDITGEFNAVHGKGAHHALNRLPRIGAFENANPTVNPVLYGKNAASINDQIGQWLLGKDFPCVAAKISVGRGTYALGAYDHSLGARSNARPMARDLRDWTLRQADFRKTESHYTTFIAAFPQPRTSSSNEHQIEKALFRQLQSLHEEDVDPWPDEATVDVSSPDFRFFFAKTAYFVIALYPEAHHLGRRSPQTLLVFNALDQFDALVERGEFTEITSVTRKNDVAISGEIHPNLKNTTWPSSGCLQFSGVDHSIDYQTWKPNLKINPPKR